LFEPINIGNLELKNRIVMPPMATHFATKEGYVTQRQIDYYVQRAKGGVGMIITESSYVHPEGRGGSNRLTIQSDESIPGLKKLTAAIHAHGVKAAAQLHHGGRQISPEALSQYPVSASSVPCIAWGVSAFPRTLTIEEIEELLEAYGKAARRAKESGYDAVQILAGHGYLLWSFLSPLGNKRTDRYGGNFENRMRFLLEIIERIRQKLGHFPIMVRLNGSDYLDGGITIEEAIKTAKRLEQAGVDCINVSAGTRESHEYQVPPRALSEGCNAYLSAAIKKAVNIPVSVAGRIRRPETAEKILQEGKADLVEIGRALICDSEWPKKAAEGRNDDILPCVSCIRCDERLFSDLDVKCTLNVAVGEEGTYKIESAKVPKRVLIAGGGPAGLEAARIAALRGHDVVLCEKNDHLGGQLKLATVAPYKTEFMEVIDYFENQLKKLDVKVELGCTVTPQLVEERKPDVVIVATGSKPFVPDIIGIKRRNVVTALDVLGKKYQVGESVVIWGSGYVAFETADFLSQRDKKVTIVTRRKVRMNIENSNGKLLLQRVSDRGVKICINTHVQEITEEGVIVERAGKKELIRMDTFVISLGNRPNTKLHEESKGKAKELYAVGSCVKPGEAFEAIRDSSLIARKI